MKPDVLFWFYKDFKTCESRLRSLRRLNKSVRVYGLYGGPLSEADKAREQLAEWLDDFYAYPEDHDAKWKRRHGDHVIAAWYRERGCHLEWQTIFIFQWDMLLLAPLETLFRNLRPGEILLSGNRPLKETETWWGWANPQNKKKRQDLESFRTLLADEFDYHGDLFACLFIVICLPRLFMEQYAASGPPLCGFIEYKVPTLARVFEIPECLDHPFDPWWAGNPATKNPPADQRTLNGVGQDIPLGVILKEAASPTGQRLFHPVREQTSEWQFKPRHAWWLYRVYSWAESVNQGFTRLRKTERGTINPPGA